MSSASAAMSPVSPFLQFHRASIGEEEIEAVREVLSSGWLTTGERVKRFESHFADHVGAAHAVALSSCTAALHLALAAIGLEEGDEVILPTMTFASSGEAVLYFRGRPVLVDSTADLFHMDPAQIEANITPRTKAIMPVHYSGYAHGLDSILEIADRRGLKVIEDAAHSFPSRFRGKFIGTFGDITCFSFYATKTITTGEGGMATTEDPKLADQMRRLSLHGISRDAWKRYSAEGSWRYDIEALGYKYNLTDLQAAIGVVQLQKCETLLARRAALAARYTQELSSLSAFSVPVTPSDVDHAWHLYVLQVNNGALKISRDAIIQELKKRGVGTSVHFIPLHLHPLYRQSGYLPGQFPNAEQHFSRAISLPLFPDLSWEEQDRVIQALHDIVRIHHC
ncbi:MAG TPA: DegT/DnrJ/EryC1/StrS family aminotransferase [Candidatus Dormibacteraeota bacterium]|jgi:dTDP-4-amino-4,6-dideoxygalactose transaminase|nr:DegT/DnrJ/EryC1/StrS family aminotransferase [Candidatus Dormibacteraeota bacterium]